MNSELLSIYSVYACMYISCIYILCVFVLHVEGMVTGMLLGMSDLLCTLCVVTYITHSM